MILNYRYSIMHPYPYGSEFILSCENVQVIRENIRKMYPLSELLYHRKNIRPIHLNKFLSKVETVSIDKIHQIALHRNSVDIEV